jgi:hypothetical protein
MPLINIWYSKKTVNILEYKQNFLFEKLNHVLSCNRVLENLISYDVYLLTWRDSYFWLIVHNYYYYCNNCIRFGFIIVWGNKCSTHRHTFTDKEVKNFWMFLATLTIVKWKRTNVIKSYYWTQNIRLYISKIRLLILRCVI